MCRGGLGRCISLWWPMGPNKSLHYPVLDQYRKHTQGGGDGTEAGDTTWQSTGRTTKALGRRPCRGSGWCMGGRGSGARLVGKQGWVQARGRMPTRRLF